MATSTEVLTGYTQEQESYEAARSRAFNRLASLLPKPKRRRFYDSHRIEVVGASGWRYLISPYSQTRIFDKGKERGQACLQLSIPAPTYDRMIAEYLLIRGDEARYLREANVFGMLDWWRSPVEVVLIVFCGVLLVLNVLNLMDLFFS